MAVKTYNTGGGGSGGDGTPSPNGNGSIPVPERFIDHDHTYSTLTDLISRAVLSPRPPLVWFVVVERRAQRPMAPREVVARRGFVAVSIVTFAVYAALGGCFFLLAGLLAAATAATRPRRDRPHPASRKKHGRMSLRAEPAAACNEGDMQNSKAATTAARTLPQGRRQTAYAHAQHSTKRAPEAHRSAA